MHEQLRTSFKLVKENPEWQCITSDFAYGTFYSIYAKFEFEENSFTPKKCEIRLQNFQGNITIGLVSIQDTIEIIYDKIVKQYVCYLKIKLRPLLANSYISQSITLENKTDFWYDTTQTPINQLNSKNLLFVDIEYADIHENDDLTSIESTNELTFIDNVRYIRDGEQIFRKKYESILGLKIIDHLASKIVEEEVEVDGVKKIVKYIISAGCRGVYVKLLE
ncbi:hypothetical protein H7U19_10415 [Hyunsoonleella sp. SJ7]|uniref:Uncharacterized protein n=1 Tax=Hyunsoonleella aquatilis TaxID=2762758 RepID=A0A923HEL1_9FLAO|nr:hypothetical protein [Hyunsoonleella aquatilis]MBC3758818.1 hypothetical protein [Hyunsoonleella aquatilis]